MKIDTFSSKYDLVSKPEIEKVAYLAFYHFKKNGHIDFLMSDVRDWFSQLHFSNPNSTRLRLKLRASSSFVRGESQNSFKLHARRIQTLQSEIQDLQSKSVEIESDGSILPETLLVGKRAYIQRFGKQINASFSQNLFDGCAVLMRRMVEICLIHSYENLKIESQIKSNPDTYKDLKDIIKNALTNNTLSLTGDSKFCLDEFRVLGNLSAHKLYYNCRFEEIDKVKMKFRLLIEELFNKAGSRVEK